MGENRSLLTVRVSPCEPLGLLGLITRVDIFGLDEATAQLKVLEALKERAKPKQKPNFPGSDLPVQRVPFPGGQPENQGVDLTVMFREAFPKRIEKWSSRQQDLLQAVRSEVQQRLDDVLNDDVLIPLAMLEQLEQVDRSPLKPRRKLKTQDGMTDLAAQPMLEVFCQAQRKLLILGDPGAGKTTTLLTLAQELMAGAIAMPGTVLPIIFELSAWKDDKQPIENWLKVQLKEMKIQPEESEEWLRDKLLLPLLDGLDELGMERQQKCIAAINQFVAQFAYPYLVVCCRNEEYREAGATLGQLKGAVSLEPLGDEQIRRYLLNVGQGELWEALEMQPEMGTMLADDEAGKPGILRVPLLLSFVAVAYEGRSFSSKGELFAAYIERRLSWNVRKAERNLQGAKGEKWAYKALELEPEPGETQHYLQWLAGRLKENFQTELLLERMQPSWLDTREQKWQYQIILGLILGLIIELILGSIIELILGLILGSGLVLIIRPGLVLFWGLGLGLELGLYEIEPVEAFRISISREAQRKLISRLELGPIVGLISGLISALRQDLEVRSRPNQGVWNSFQSMIWTTLLVYSSGVILVYFPTIANAIIKGQNWYMVTQTLLKNLPDNLIPGAGALVALFLGFYCGGGIPFIQHFCLRFILILSHLTPWRYVRFLNYCVDRRLLQRVGGRYRFLHRELLEHFAGGGG